MKTVSIVVSMVWIVAALYVGIGGWTAFQLQIDRESALSRQGGIAVTYREVTYRSVEELNVELDEERAARWFPWIRSTPRFGALAASSFAFGALGAMLRLVRQVSTTPLTSAEAPLLAFVPMGGGLLGVILLGLAHFVPGALVQASEFTVRPISVFVLCMLGGLYTDEIVAWIRAQLVKMF